MSNLTVQLSQDRTARRWGELPNISQRIHLQEEEHIYPPVIHGGTPKSGDLVLANNDYLNLSNERDIVDAQIAALQQGSQDIFMSGVFSHMLAAQEKFETEMAAFLGAEASILCQSGFAANDALLQSLADPTTPVYVDFRAHASIWQGIRSANAPAYGFRHNSASHLAKLIERNGPGIIAVDSVYSTTGDLCPLEEFVELAEQTGCILLVDESHGIGVYGPNGEGLVVELGLSERVHYRTFSLSKAFVGRAGMIVGPALVLRLVRYESRPCVFSSAVLHSEIARFQATLQAVRNAGDRRDKILRLARRLRSGLYKLGYGVSDDNSPIIPVEPGSEEDTAILRDALESHGVFGAVFCAPATPASRTMIRFCVHAGLNDEDIDRLIAVFAEIKDEVGMQQWASTRRRAKSFAIPVKMPAPTTRKAQAATPQTGPAVNRPSRETVHLAQQLTAHLAQRQPAAVQRA